MRVALFTTCQIAYSPNTICTRPCLSCHVRTLITQQCHMVTTYIDITHQCHVVTTDIENQCCGIDRLSFGCSDPGAVKRPCPKLLWSPTASPFKSSKTLTCSQKKIFLQSPYVRGKRAGSWQKLCFCHAGQAQGAPTGGFHAQEMHCCGPLSNP